MDKIKKVKTGLKDVTQKIADYLRHHITLKELVDLAENMMTEVDFESQDFETSPLPCMLH